MRNFTWIGRFTSAVELTEVWHTSPVKTIEDATKRETILAATSPGSTTDFYPRLMNKVAGTRFKIIKGYSGTSGSVLAMERGETEGSLDAVDALLFIRPDWLSEKKVSILVQYAQKRHPAIPDVPALAEFGTSSEDKQALAIFASAADVGRSLMAPPGIPPDRVAVLRHAFMAMTADPAFREQVAKSKIELGPLPGETMQKMMADTLNVSPAVLARAVELNRE
jgi:tripartite-type tricarboxylate transporter receptor subunit TctC